MFDPQLFDRLRQDVTSALPNHVSDPGVAKDALDQLGRNKPTWRELAMFCPPRLVAALTTNQLVPFVGAGISIAAGVPSWSELLQKHLKLTRTYLGDEDLRNDPLTMAEIASQRIGATQVQATLRALLGRASVPTTSHVVLAALRCPIYITTNYDNYLENA